MEKYMGYRAGNPAAGDPAAGDPAAQNPAIGEDRLLPVFDISGTEFIVDMARHEFRQADNPYNRITMGGIKEEMGFTHFFYDTRTKNVYTGDTSEVDKLPPYVSIILVPPLKDLDPVGLARRQGLADDFYKKGTNSSMQLLTAFTRQYSSQKKTVKAKHGKHKKGKAKRARR